MARSLGPDPIDQAMAVTKPAGWYQLAALAFLVFGAVIWAALVEVPLKIKAKGVLLNEEGLVEITTSSRGRIIQMDVSPGDIVRKGDLIATEAQPEFDSQLAIRRAQLAEAEAHERSLIGLNGALANAQGSAASSRVRAARERIALLAGQERALAERGQGLLSLAAKGYVTKDAILRNDSELSGIRQQLSAARNEIVLSTSDGQVQDVQRQRELAGVRSNIARLQAEIVPLEQQALNDREIRSPYSGRITEVRYGAGEYVDIGTPITSLAQSVGGGAHDEGKLHAIAFVPAEQGKEIRKGMRVDVSPSGVKANEYGFIVGTVLEVGASPASTAGMMRVLKNDQLVRQLSEQGAPFKVVVELERAATPTGFRWTSSNGPPNGVDSGMPMTAEFVTRDQRLLGLVLPPLARFFAK
ncbi:NHLP bacteriocin system secretion protein [Sphingomonas naphthae]|uniref:NHLP bacteriocin system secretion protein n=1 Tax=Sphingomonas naphthae TaxID=1813468 RepID=A0ABY7TMA9_9SPHN|nr:NHLP bacteriocin system secretion protein [Sphingomonas naphthae]WCT74173.1 NHLP bacteriocin system secretion protein [Sphingomonas naphthae]